jgi:A/G-specific adenine glycosylase
MTRTTSTLASLSQIKPAHLRKFHASLAKWYQTHGRHDLPWRNTKDPYPIWLSEVMLQQTQVATVRERFYFPFLEKFPTIEALAAAPRESVMKAWEGLGYYRRAGFLHEAAKLVSSSRACPGISRNMRPLLPTAQEWNMLQEIPGQARDDSLLQSLLSLPGVGKNTAHAILAFAYHQPVAILEANVKRVVARVFALETPSEAELWAGAEMLLNKTAPFDYNQAMMDVGSLICTPKKPRCGECPAHSICQGNASPERYPAPKAKKKIPTREVLIHVREDARGRLFLEKRAEALLGGLYGFVQTPYKTSKKRRVASHGEPLAAGVSAKRVGGEAPPSIIGQVTHTYSHFKLIGQVVYERIASKPNAPDWHTREEIAALPLSTLDHKVLALVDKCHSADKKTIKRWATHKAR